MVWVYILWSEKLQQFYIGQCIDPGRRLDEHNSGQNTSTRTGLPWIMVWKTNKADKTQAMRLERKLKNLRSSDRIRTFIDKYSN